MQASLSVSILKKCVIASETTLDLTDRATEGVQAWLKASNSWQNELYKDDAIYRMSRGVTNNVWQRDELITNVSCSINYKEHLSTLSVVGRSIGCIY